MALLLPGPGRESAPFTKYVSELTLYPTGGDLWESDSLRVPESSHKIDPCSSAVRASQRMVKTRPCNSTPYEETAAARRVRIEGSSVLWSTEALSSLLLSPQTLLKAITYARPQGVSLGSLVHLT
jgi:hypothetical protein